MSGFSRTNAPVLWCFETIHNMDTRKSLIDDELTAEERAELHASLDRALDDAEAARGMDAWEFVAPYRACREDRSTR